MRRIENYLNLPDVVSVEDDKATTVSFESASVAWPAAEVTPLDERFILRDVSVDFPRGALSLISGKTGTGKSLMLSAILGDVDVLSGAVRVPSRSSDAVMEPISLSSARWEVSGAMAYVAQIPWIENASLCDNIIAPLPLNRARLDAVIDACALRKDVDMLEDGELTEIGANGINISGGQKWRLTLARAIYSRAEILVLDDVFSAVDAHVGRHILDQCLSGPLCQDRTVILVTHHTGLCRGLAKYLVVLGNGGVVYAGSIEDAPEDLIAIDSKEAARAENQACHSHYEQQEVRQRRLSNNRSENETCRPRIEDPASISAADVGVAKPPRKFIEDEERARGAVKSAIWLTYFRSTGGKWFLIGAIVLFSVTQGLMMGRSWWIKIWTAGVDSVGNMSFVMPAMVRSLSRSLGHPLHAMVVQSEFAVSTSVAEHASSSLTLTTATTATATTTTTTTTTTTVTTSAGEKHDVMYYIGIFILISAVNIIAVTIRCLYVCVGLIRASRELFRRLTSAVLRKSQRWFDTTPEGRLLNRFTRDFAMIDEELLDGFNLMVASGFLVMGSVLSAVIIAPITLLAGIPIFAATWYLGAQFQIGARPSKRLMATTVSLVMDQYSTAITGAATIRAFGRQQAFMSVVYDRIDHSATAMRQFRLFYQWLGWRTTVVCAALVGLVSAVVLYDVSISAGAAGFSLSFFIGLPDALFDMLRFMTFFETSMTSAERVLEYADGPVETVEGHDAPVAWPTEGRILVDNLVVAYAPELPDILKGVSFDVKPGERIGIIGRTGSGKSSLTLALFRFLEARQGKIAIDGIDISSLKLKALRSRLAIIPQVCRRVSRWSWLVGQLLTRTGSCPLFWHDSLKS